GLKPAMIGIILATGIYMTHKAVRAADGGLGFDGKALILMHIIIFYKIFSKRILKKKPSPIFLICLSAVLGAVIFAL
ncbi:MAG: chromate transporter, partial [Peptococcaceae bacterium]|nr:chromate transporter [Peptococcaceae bacterium]